jgi:hypothetical protein
MQWRMGSHSFFPPSQKPVSSIAARGPTTISVVELPYNRCHKEQGNIFCEGGAASIPIRRVKHKDTLIRRNILRILETWLWLKMIHKQDFGYVYSVVFLHIHLHVFTKI